ncbi:MAG: sugar phosphate isomerase/epimerase [Candidatus Acidiferrales bacterium]|jgi:sugar phosphate isomerase/epimerase
MDRRKFLQQAAWGLGVAALSHFSLAEAYAKPLDLPIGLQLYTVRDELQKDMEGTLRAVADVGYREVEHNFTGYEVPRVRAALAAANLRVTSMNYTSSELTVELDAKLDRAKTLGSEYLACTYLEGFNLQARDTQAEVTHTVRQLSLDDFKRAADLFNHVGDACHRAGLGFAYHAHNFEFTPLGDTYGYQEILRRTDPKLVQIEADCYWFARAGKDVVEYFEKYPGRFPLLHLKDMKPGRTPTVDFHAGADAFTEVGRGVIDWKRIFRAAPAAGVKRAYVEQDFCEHSPFESIRISYDYLHNLQI